MLDPRGYVQVEPPRGPVNGGRANKTACRTILSGKQAQRTEAAMLETPKSSSINKALAKHNYLYKITHFMGRNTLWINQKSG